MNSFTNLHARGSGRMAVLAVAMSFAVSGIAPAQPAGPGPARIVTMTVGMKVFGNAEQQIIDALRAGEAATLDRLVQPEFEQRVQGAPGQALVREDWVKQAPADAARSVGFRQMAVHDYGDVVVVSFQWLHPAPDFVVDVWQKKGGSDEWQLAVRYLSPAPATATAAPAASASRRPSRPAPAPSPVDPKR